MNEPIFLQKVLQNNANAVQFCTSVGFISQVWDDLIDNDKTVPPETISAAFWECLVTLPLNPFYRAYMPQLQPMMQLVISDWMDANKLEEGRNLDCLHISFVLRDRMTSLVVQCALLVGGYQWAQDVGPDIRKFYFDEAFDVYKERLDQ